jgi:hypothetical protein
MTRPYVAPADVCCQIAGCGAPFPRPRDAIRAASFDHLVGQSGLWGFAILVRSRPPIELALCCNLIDPPLSADRRSPFRSPDRVAAYPVEAGS